MSRHTPGPWKTAGRGPTGYSIATSEHHGFSIIPHMSMTDAKREANARLIAAAPDLLAALQDIAALSHLIPQPATHDGLQIADALAAARRAIATATATTR